VACPEPGDHSPVTDFLGNLANDVDE